MRYTRIQRNNTGNFITIGDYIKHTQLSVYRKLSQYVIKSKLDSTMMLAASGFLDVTELVLAAADIFGADKQYARIMQERPKGGRGGLLHGEKEEDL